MTPLLLELFEYLKAGQRFLGSLLCATGLWLMWKTILGPCGWRHRRFWERAGFVLCVLGFGMFAGFWPFGDFRLSRLLSR